MTSLEQIRQEYLIRLEEKARLLSELKTHLSAEDPEIENQVRGIAHQIAGSAGTYGFTSLTDPARALENGQPEFIVAAIENLLINIAQILPQKTQVTIKPAQKKKKNILVIDDDSDIYRLLQAKLESSEFEISIAAAGQTALRVIEDGEYEIILIDLQLPDIDGRALLSQLRENTQTEKSIFVVMSAVQAQAIKEECFALGAHLYIEKPFNIDLLIQLLYQIIGSTNFPTIPQKTNEEAKINNGEETIQNQNQNTENKNIKILIADDDELILSFIQHRLARENINLQCVTDGQKALELLNSQAIDLFILDIQMPGLNGLELLTRIRNIEQYKKTPIMMLSALGHEKDISHAFQKGANDYLIKPFSPVELLARIRRLMQS